MNYEKLGYRVGSIYRVKMKNFLTYDECEVFPGPKLNVVIGPNGTGKSTMTHAICLACCGSAGDVGRASDLSKFVKIGKEKEICFVEVDLVSGPTSVYTIARQINAENNGSKWSLNHQPVTQSRVKELVRDLKIDVDNLCSFMPQDKVGKFTLYTPKEILQNTLKSISGVGRTSKNSSDDSQPTSKKPKPLLKSSQSHKSKSSANAIEEDSTNEEDDNDHNHNNNELTISDIQDGNNLHQEQIELSSIEDTKESYRREKDAAEKKLQDLIRELATLTTDLDRLKKKDKAKEMKNFYEIKLLKTQMDILLTEKEGLENDCNIKQEELIVAKKSITPMEKEISNMKKDLVVLDKEERQLLQQNQKAKGEIESYIHQIESDDMKIETIKQEMESYLIERNQLQLKQMQLQKDITDLQEKLQSIQLQKQQWSKEMTTYQTQQKTQYTSKQLKSEEYDELRHTLQHEKEQYQGIMKELHELQVPENVFKQKLLQITSTGGSGSGGGGGGYNDRMFRDCIQAMEWIEKNMEHYITTKQLKSPIYGPIGKECTVKEIACAMMIEKVIPINRLLGFIVLNDDDRVFLTNELRKKLHLQIDIFTMKNIVNTNTFIRPYSHTFLDAQLKPHGIVGYLSEQLQCSEIIRSFLYQFHGLHTVLWGKNHQEIPINVMSSLCSNNITQFRLFMHDPPTNRREIGVGNVIEYAGKKSKYAPNAPPSTVSNNITSRGLVNTGIDDVSIKQKQQTLQQTLTKQQQTMKQIEDQVTLVQKEIQEMELSNSVIRNEIDNLKKKLTQDNNIIRKLSEYEKQLADITKQLSLDSEKEMNHKKLQLKEKINVILKRQTSLLMKSKESYPYSMRLVLLSCIKNHLQEQMKAKEIILHTFQSQLTTLQTQLTQIKQQIQQKITLLTKQNEKLVGIAQEYDEDFAEIIFPKVLECCPENTIEEIEEKLISLDAQIKAIVDNPNLIKRYEQLVAEEKIMQSEVVMKKAKYEDVEKDLTNRATLWLSRVHAIVNKLNKRFANYMQTLQFDGEIVLKEIGKFIDYEMILKVSFRQESSLVELSGCRHSGGERAVSTIMYLMALQDMACSPFRVVDEINQGMDERNERLVVDRIVRNCSQGIDGSDSQHQQQKPQYFLVTPKLLQGLTSLHHPDVTILLIWNGPGIQEKWKFNELLAFVRKQRGGGGAISSSLISKKKTLKAGGRAEKKQLSSSGSGDTNEEEDEENENDHNDDEDEYHSMRQKKRPLAISTTAVIQTKAGRTTTNKNDVTKKRTIEEITDAEEEDDEEDEHEHDDWDDDSDAGPKKKTKKQQVGEKEVVIKKQQVVKDENKPPSRKIILSQNSNSNTVNKKSRRVSEILDTP